MKKNLNEKYIIIVLSKENGLINWSNVDKSEFDGVLIKCGYRLSNTLYNEDYFEKNIKACINYKIPFGIFFISNAQTIEQSENDAEYINDLISKYKNKLSLPIYYSLIFNNFYINMLNTFIEKLESSGYEIGICTNQKCYNNYIKNEFDDNSIWIEDYDLNKENENEKFDMVKSKENLKISGIDKYVIMNYCYRNLAEKVKIKNSIKNKTIDELARETFKGKFSNNGERKKILGSLYDSVQKRVNEFD